MIWKKLCILMAICCFDCVLLPLEMQQLSQEVTKIQMPKEMEERIVRSCYEKMEEADMRKDKSSKRVMKPLAAVATMVICVGLVGVTALATSGKLQGFFKDITRWDGAVVGTSYEQATDEIQLSVIGESDKLIVTAEFVNRDIAPYFTFENFGIENYELVDANGNVVVEDAKTELVEIVEGKTTFEIPVSGLGGGNFKLVVSSFVGSAKADQPLVMSGNWECEFER